MAHGKTIRYADGGKYVGDVLNGVPNGVGTWTQPSGMTYVGEWLQNYGRTLTI